jgi:hypothetical protein
LSRNATFGIRLGGGGGDGEDALRGICFGGGFLGVCVAVFCILFSIVALRRDLPNREKTRRLNGGGSAFRYEMCSLVNRFVSRM